MSEISKDTLLLKFREQCLKRGASGIKGIGLLWKTLGNCFIALIFTNKLYRKCFKFLKDDDGSRTLTKDELITGVLNHNINISKDDISKLFDMFDTNHNGTIDYNEFLVELRPPLNTTRINLIRKAFEKLDKTKDNRITVDDLKGVYNAKKHTKYLNGEWTEEQCLQKFLDTFEISQHKDGIVTYDEFVNYYAGVSASIDSDVYFDLMMKNSWKI